MSTLDSSLNRIVCTASSNTVGPGLLGCLATIKKSKKFLLTSRGYKFDGAVDFTDDYLKTLTASGAVTAFGDVNEILDLSTKLSFTDLGEGREAVENEGLYKFDIKFIKGLYQNKALNSYNGDSRFDILFVDTDGKLVGTTATDGSLKGFSLGVHHTETMEGIFGSNVAKQSFIVHLTDTAEMANYAIKTPDDDFDGRNILAINEVVLTLTAPADTDTTVTIKAVRAQDGEPFTGAVFGQFLVKTNGATTNPTGGDDSATAGTYVLTGVTALSATDIVAANLYDNTNSRAGIEVGGDQFKSNTSTATVV